MKRSITAGLITTDLSSGNLKEYLIDRLEENILDMQSKPLSGFGIEIREQSPDYGKAYYYETEKELLRFNFVKEYFKKKKHPVTGKEELVPDYITVECAIDLQTKLLIVCTKDYPIYKLINKKFSSTNPVTITDVSWRNDFIKWLIDEGENHPTRISQVTGFRVTDLDDSYGDSMKTLKANGRGSARNSSYYQSVTAGTFRSAEVTFILGGYMVSATVWAGTRTTMFASDVNFDLFFWLYRHLWLALTDLYRIFT